MIVQDSAGDTAHDFMPEWSVYGKTIAYIVEFCAQNYIQRCVHKMFWVYGVFVKTDVLLHVSYVGVLFSHSLLNLTSKLGML